MHRIILICLSLPCILLGLSLPAAAQNVTIQLTPQGLPIQIPGSGGSFNYTIAAANNGTMPQQAQVWCMVNLPNGNPYGPVLGPVRVTIGASQTLSRLRTQNVPAGAPAGDYSFNAYMGVYPDTIWDSDSFAFEKTLAGAELWVARYNGLDNYSDEAFAIAADEIGNVCVTGRTPEVGVSGYDVATIKYDVSGNQLWVALYGTATATGDCGRALTLDDSGNIYIAGFRQWTTYNDYLTLKYNGMGGLLWAAQYNGPGNGDDQAIAIAVDPDRNVYVTGLSDANPGATNYDYATIKYDAAGDQVWVARYDHPGYPTGYDIATDLALDVNGNVYVTGYSTGGYIQDYATIKYNSSGIQQWEARYDGPGHMEDWAYAIATSADGSIYVTGRSQGAGTDFDFATIKYDDAGVQQWAARYNGPGNGDDQALDIAVDSTGNVFVTGFSLGSTTNLDYATVKYDANGNQLWVTRYDGPGNSWDRAYSLAIDATGNIYVTGGSVGSGNEDYATIKYDTFGNLQWAARYNGPGNGFDAASAIAIGGEGQVYVTGKSHGGASWYDYCTIKYSGGNIDNWLPVEATILGQPLPQEYDLEPNYPNPFNAATVLSYQLPVAANINLRIYDTAGRLIETLVDGWRAAGSHQMTFDASHLPSGMYFARLEAGEYAEVQKLVLLK